MYRYQGFGFYSARPLMSTCVFIGVFVISFGVIYALSMWNQRACSKQGVFGFLFHSQRMMKQTATQAGNESDTTKTQYTMNALYAARNDEYSFWQLMKRYALPATLVLTLAWSFCLIIHFPGTITFDTAAQMLQIDGLSPWRANHPPATTVLYGAFFLLGDIIGSRNIGLFFILRFAAYRYLICVCNWFCISEISWRKTLSYRSFIRILLNNAPVSFSS